MPPAPPRRPRRWWTILVQSAICVGLAAMVAMPERHVQVWAARFGRCYRMDRSSPTRADGGLPAVIDADSITVEHLANFVSGGTGGGSTSCCPVHQYYYRDAGLHVLLGELFE